MLRRLGRSLLLLLLNQVQFRVVARELSQRDKEVSQSQTELVILSVERKQTLDKRRDLCT